jgi:hypothetical protein
MKHNCFYSFGGKYRRPILLRSSYSDRFLICQIEDATRCQWQHLFSKIDKQNFVFMQVFRKLTNYVWINQKFITPNITRQSEFQYCLTIEPILQENQKVKNIPLGLLIRGVGCILLQIRSGGALKSEFVTRKLTFNYNIIIIHFYHLFSFLAQHGFWYDDNPSIQELKKKIVRCNIYNEWKETHKLLDCMKDNALRCKLWLLRVISWWRIFVETIDISARFTESVVRRCKMLGRLEPSHYKITH